MHSIGRRSQEAPSGACLFMEALRTRPASWLNTRLRYGRAPKGALAMSGGWKLDDLLFGSQLLGMWWFRAF